MFIVFCGKLPGDTRFFARRNAESPESDSPGVGISHFECDAAGGYEKCLQYSSYSTALFLNLYAVKI